LRAAAVTQAGVGCNHAPRPGATRLTWSAAPSQTTRTNWAAGAVERQPTQVRVGSWLDVFLRSLVLER
jgi:hypothetical protein